MLHGDGLWELAQHPLLEVLESLIVITTTDKLLVLRRRDEQRWMCFLNVRAETKVTLLSLLFIALGFFFLIVLVQVTLTVLL